MNDGEQIVKIPCALCGETLGNHEFITYYKSGTPDEQQAYMCPGVIDSCQYESITKGDDNG